MKIEKELIEIYKSACWNAFFHCYSQPLNDFKNNYPKEFVYLHRFYRIRTELNNDIQLMSSLGYQVYWCTLTFDEISENEKKMRDKAFRFLNDVFSMFVAVEEHGEDNGRYHLHLFGCFKVGKTFEDYFKWSSRSKIETLAPYKMKKKVRYVTNYAVKVCPRLRRNKKLVAVRKEEEKRRKWSNIGFNFYEKTFKQHVTDIFDDELPF